ncbi:hypothetical protein C0993_009325 [Termitomyces sp. T159_Od127]|nr:hypothetical protein C0993_009325 [Termitomyces sp. T159_Od127]
MSLSGTVYPDDKKIVVTNEVNFSCVFVSTYSSFSEISTILQFRAIDYGMEICELHIDLPQSSAAAERVEAISVYRLESSSPLDVRSLSYRTRPRRLGRLGDVHAAINAEVDWHRKMTCKLEEVLTLELACPEDIPVGTQCSLEWWQRKEESIPGNDPCR